MTDQQARILCVDDEENVLRALKRLFMDEEYEILTAGSGPEGLALMEKESEVQVILADFRMPGMNGVEFLHQVFERWPETVRIVLSGFADTGTVVSAINEGHIYKFIPKPWNDDELKVTIAKAIDYYFLRKNNELLTRELKDANEELRLLNERLSALVTRRTEEVIFRGKVIDHAQSLLDAIPMGILGLDNEGTVVQCNRRARELLANDGLIGFSMREVLPAELLAFVSTLSTAQVSSQRIQLAGQDCLVKAAALPVEQPGLAGYVVVFDRIS